MFQSLRQELKLIWLQQSKLLKTAIESQDVEGQIAAQEQIANLTMDAARLNAMKVAAESKPKEVNK